jgi:membrane-bound lytic murein transglycosylase D
VRALAPAGALVLASFVPAGCRSGAAAVAPPAPAAVPAAPQVAPVESAVPPPPPAEPREATASLSVAPEVLPPEEAAPEEEPASEAERLQREALEACQSAEELLAQGHVEAAIASVDRAYALMLDLPAGDDTSLQAKEDIRVLAADLIARAYRSARRAPSGRAASWDLALPVAENRHVQREIQSFTGVERASFLEGYQRSFLYRPMILEKLEKASLPSQLSWLPLVESSFKVRALSRASALGMWQFIASTGVRYGLSRDAWVDERLDPEKATDAAIAYLTDLHGLFGDWPKALAAYNCGEARVLRLSRAGDGEYVDFWDLYEGLPGETRRYVPRLLAALLILDDPARYGMELPAAGAPPARTSVVRVERSVKLETLDRALSLEPGTLAAQNPELRRQATPRRPYDLRVPAGREEAIAAALAASPEWTPPPAPRYATHRVRSGETLSTIARRYGTSVSALMRANGLASPNRLRAGQRLRVPSRGAAAGDE